MFVCLGSRAFARKLGPKFYDEHALKDTYQGSMRLFLESYFDLVFCMLLNGMALVEALRTGTIEMFFNGLGNILSSTMTVISVLAVPLFLIWAYVAIRRSDLEDDSVKDRLSFLLDGVKAKNLSSKLYTVYFISRRLMTTCVLYFMTSLPFF